jgi:hypothetical protein
MPEQSHGKPGEEHEMGDGPEQASESGEPGEAGRSHGQVIDPRSGEPLGRRTDAHPGQGGDAEDHLESGRHDAAET